MIKNIKLAVFDFDDTLAIHKDKDYLEHREELGKITILEKHLKTQILFMKLLSLVIFQVICIILSVV